MKSFKWFPFYYDLNKQNKWLFQNLNFKCLFGFVLFWWFSNSAAPHGACSGEMWEISSKMPRESTWSECTTVSTFQNLRKCHKIPEEDSLKRFPVEIPKEETLWKFLRKKQKKKKSKRIPKEKRFRKFWKEIWLEILFFVYRNSKRSLTLENSVLNRERCCEL